MSSRQSGGHHPPVGSPYRAHLARCRWICFMWELSIPKVLRKRRVSGWICCEVFPNKTYLKISKKQDWGIYWDYALFPMAFLGKCKFWMDCSHTLGSGWPGKPVKVSFTCWLSSWMPIRSLFLMPERRGLHWTIRSEIGTPVLVLHPHHLAVKRNLHCPTIIWDWPVISSVCVLSDFLWISTIVATCSGWCFKTS